MKRLGILTSGGDAAGMNAAIRAVVRTALHKGWEVTGIRQGYAGLMTGEVISLGARDVRGIIWQGGTMLGSARCPEFKEEKGRMKAVRTLRRLAIDGLIVIGGNGSQTGAHALWKMGVPVIGIASTIDNDLHGSEITIGVDTALNVALEAIDRLKTTASSHERAFLVEVMGRRCGYLALMAGIAGGADCIVIPEREVSPDAVAVQLREAYQRGKTHGLVVVAEGAKYNASTMADHFEQHRERLGFELRTTTLGHVQRGGQPGSFDRLLGARLGAAATEYLEQGEQGILVGWVRGKVASTSLDEVVSQTKPLDLGLFELAEVLAK